MRITSSILFEDVEGKEDPKERRDARAAESSLNRLNKVHVLIAVWEPILVLECPSCFDEDELHLQAEEHSVMLVTLV
jgi:hypothetical protein